MAETFHFSPRPNRAHEIDWRPWGADAFQEARDADKPVLLNLTAVWCHWCHRMDETTYSDEGLIRRINDSLVPIRVDTDRYPHVEARYIAGGWPTTAFLAPTGEVLWAGTYVEPDEFRAVLRSVVSAWSDANRRRELSEEIERRRKAMETSRAQRSSVALVRREAADDVMTAIQEGFDPRNGGFGEAPKFPRPAALEALFVLGRRFSNPDWLEMADRTLDGMLAGAVWDPVEGGFFRYATAADWTAPHYEKLLEVNAELMRVYALGAHVRDRDNWREVVERIVAWADRTLSRRGGLWGGSQDAREEYYQADAEGRAAQEAPHVDATVYTNRNAQWIRALAEAGGRLGREDWVQAAADGLEILLEAMAAPDDLLYHYRLPDGEATLPGMLTDLVETVHACLAVAQATGREGFLAHARRLVAGMERALWADKGGFVDHAPGPDDVAALRYPDRPFDLNASAARALVDLSLATGERSYRALAERILAVLSPLAGRYGIQGADFALAAEMFFDAPLRIVVVGPREETEALRRTALTLPEIDRRVWSLEKGGRLGTLTFPAEKGTAAYVCGHRTCSAPVREPEALAAVVERFR